MSLPFPNSLLATLAVIGIHLPTAVFGYLFYRSRTSDPLHRRSEASEPKTKGEADEYLPTLEISDTPSDSPSEFILPLPLQKEKGEAEEVMLRELASLARDENLRGLIESRLDDMKDEDEGVPRALAMVGLLDEIRILSPASEGQDAQLLQTIDAMIRKQLETMGPQVIDDDEWDPSRQKAVETRRDLPGGAESIIAEIVASGHMFEGRVRRKQSVILHTEP